MKPGETGPFLNQRFPFMFDRDDEDPGQWFPMPADLPRFLRHIFPNSLVARELVLELFQHLTFFVGKFTLVRLSDDTAARRIGIDDKSIRRCRASEDFLRVVTVCPGERRRKGEEPTATLYDLKRLQLRYNSWRCGDEDPTKAEIKAGKDMFRAMVGARGRERFGREWKALTEAERLDVSDEVQGFNKNEAA